MTQDEMEVLAALRNGDLSPLADLLAHEERIHPMIQRELRIMITGWAERDFTLQLVSRVHHKSTKKAKGEQRAKEVRLAARALDLGAAERGKRDGAVMQAAQEQGLNPETAMTYFKRRRRTVAMFRHHTRAGRQEGD
ncbi:hypothetical protein ABC955_10285 [Citromicrobium bathyomarinum]